MSILKQRELPHNGDVFCTDPEKTEFQAKRCQIAKYSLAKQCPTKESNNRRQSNSRQNSPK